VSTCLQLDVGNSGAKWRLVQGQSVVARGCYSGGDPDSRDAMLACTPTVNKIWISSVAADGAERELAGVLSDRWGVQPWFARTEACTDGLVNSYPDPARMGVDRWLAMLGARRRRGRLCVVDAGSALTIDLVAADGRHEGGYIIPGPELMERALLLDTDRVRFAEDVDYRLSPGHSTAEAVRHGIALAQTGAVAMAVDAAGGEPPGLIFSGGAGATVMELLGRGGDYVPDLVFEGLERMAALSGR